LIFILKVCNIIKLANSDITTPNSIKYIENKINENKTLNIDINFEKKEKKSKENIILRNYREKKYNVIFNNFH
jgi:hypothetical protein